MQWFAVLMIMGWLTSATAAQAQVMVYGPGSMAETLEQIAVSAARSGLAIKAVSGHSPAQARQIAEGAPADIFISADPVWMDHLRGKALLSEGSEAALASTRLVLIALAGNTRTYGAKPGESLVPLLGDGRLAIADPDTVPAGRFARAALEQLRAWDSVSGRLALLPNVRTVVAMVERGEVAVGIGFASDVSGQSKVRIVTEFPRSVAPPVSFPIAIIAGHDREDVRKAYDFIRGPGGLLVLRAGGFDEPQP